VALFFALVTLFLMDRSFDAEPPGQIKELPMVARVILSFGYKRRFVELILDVAGGSSVFWRDAAAIRPRS